MRSCGWLVIAACAGDPSLEISVHHPTGFAVVQTLVTVYFGTDVACSAIEFGDLTDADLAAIAADAVDVTSGARVEVSRLGGKAIVARGYDDQHRFVTAGCKDVGEITSGTTVAITTQPTAVIAIDPGQADRPFGERTIIVNMSDPNGQDLDGMVSWQLSGPAGAPEPPPATGVATRNGNARISVNDLGTPGPEGLRIRVPWATAPLPLVTGFDLSRATTIPYGGGAITGPPSCDVRGHAGKLATLVCLAQASGTHRDAVEIAWQTDHYTMTPLAIPGAIDNQQVLFVDHDGSADEPVYVLSANAAGVGNWYKLGAPSGRVMVFEGAIDHAVYVAKCKDNATTALVGVQTGTAIAPRRQLFKPNGDKPSDTLDTAQNGEVLSGGCVADVDKVEHQGIVTSAGANMDAVLSLVTATGAIPVSSARLTGSGFVAVETQGMIEKRFAGTRLQATGTVVFEAVLATDGASYKLVERTELEAAAPPGTILAGKLDKDGDTDLMWDLATGLRRRVFQVSLAKQVSGAPLTAMTSGAIQTSSVTPTGFLVGDLNGGRADEMIVFTQSAITIYSAD